MADSNAQMEYPIYADDDSFSGILCSTYMDGTSRDIKLKVKRKGGDKVKIVSLNHLLLQAYNPAQANQRRNKTK